MVLSQCLPRRCAAALITVGLALVLVSQMASAQHEHGPVGPKAGTYLGYLMPDAAEVKVPLRLELIAVQSDDDFTHLRAFAKVELGGHGSREYVSYYYERVAFSWAKGELIFEDGENALILNDGAVHEMNGRTMIMGTFRSVAGGAKGALSLVHVEDPTSFDANTLLSKIAPAKTVVSSLSGHYAGTCEDKQVRLELEAFPWTRAEGIGQSPSHGLRITGRWGVADDTACPGSFCQLGPRFSDGRYDFYRQRLSLVGHPKSRYCRVTDKGLNCEGCLLEKADVRDENDVHRTQVFRSAVRTHSPEVENDGPLPEIASPADLTGTYFGYLHHENLDRYQPVVLSVTALSYSDRPNRPERLHVSAMASLGFGGDDLSELVSYKFHQRPYVTSDELVFDGDVDAMFRVDDWTEKKLSGTWFSKRYGRAGTLELVRGAWPELPPSAHRIAPVAGRYSSQEWSFELTTSDDAEGQSRAPYPLAITGSARFKELTATKRIQRGHYDFYSNTLSVELEDGRVVTGHVSADRAHLFWPGRPTWGIYLGDHRRSEFERKDPWNF